MISVKGRAKIMCTMRAIFTLVTAETQPVGALATGLDFQSQVVQMQG